MSIEKRVGIGIIVFGLIVLGLVMCLPRYQPSQKDVLYHQIDSLNTELEIYKDNGIRLQMLLRFKGRK